MINRRRYQILYPIDRAAIALILVLSVAIAAIAWGGNACTGDCWLHAGPRVRQFNWRDRQIAADDTAFLVTFSRPMDKASVEENLTIEPPLPGKTSWVGRTMAYTLETPAPYGTQFNLRLQGAQERFSATGKLGAPIQPFESQFTTRDRAFVYIGVEGEEEGRLILFNLTQDQKTILTPPNLIVTDFRAYPDRETILLIAADRSDGELDLLEQKLYITPTGLGSKQDLVLGTVEVAVDNQDGYQNLKFDLSQDGKTIVVQRINRQNPADSGLWVKREKEDLMLLNNTPSGDFEIAPDSTTLVSSQGQGVAVLSLQPDSEPLDFLPKFGRILDFDRDGSKAVMVDFNQNDPDLRYTQSLYVVNNQGVQRPLVDIKGSIVNCQFAPAGTTLYCLFTELIEGEQYVEQPFLAAIDLQENKGIPLMKLPNHRDVKISLAPDGLGLLFDRVVVDPKLDRSAVLRTNSGEAIADSNLWLLLTSSSLPEEDNEPVLEELPIAGMRPQWLP